MATPAETRCSSRSPASSSRTCAATTSRRATEARSSASCCTTRTPSAPSKRPSGCGPASSRRRLTYEGKSLAVTVSLGVAQYDPSRDLSGKSLIDRADHALYASKQDRSQSRDRRGLGRTWRRIRIANRKGERRLAGRARDEPGRVDSQFAARRRRPDTP